MFRVVRLLAGLWLIIALAFPLLELAGIIYIWHRIGAWTLVWLFASAVAGGLLIAGERASFMPRMMGTLMSGEDPFALLKGSGLRFVAGFLLIFPGPISDVLALLLLLWGGLRPPPPPMPRGFDRAANDDVIEGEYRRVDD